MLQAIALLNIPVYLGTHFLAQQREQNQRMVWVASNLKDQYVENLLQPPTLAKIPIPRV